MKVIEENKVYVQKYNIEYLINNYKVIDKTIIPEEIYKYIEYFEEQYEILPEDYYIEFNELETINFFKKYKLITDKNYLKEFSIDEIKEKIFNIESLLDEIENSIDMYEERNDEVVLINDIIPAYEKLQNKLLDYRKYLEERENEISKR